MEILEIDIPNNIVELQDFLDDLWDKIFEQEKTELIHLYNQAAEKYNKKCGSSLITIIHNFKKQKMAKAKTAVKKSATKKATKKVVKKSVPKKVITTSSEKKPSQKAQIVELAEKGKTIEEIVEITGFKKTNVSWYFYKLKLGKSNEHTDKG